MSLDEHDPEIAGLEAALAALVPMPGRVNRDALLFRAGQLSVRGRGGAWPYTTAALALPAAAALPATPGLRTPPQELGSLPALEVGVEDEAALVRGANEHHAHRGLARVIHGGERRGVRLRDIRAGRERGPFQEQPDGIGRLGHRLGTDLPDFSDGGTGRYFTPS